MWHIRLSLSMYRGLMLKYHGNVNMRNHHVTILLYKQYTELENVTLKSNIIITVRPTVILQL